MAGSVNRSRKPDPVAQNSRAIKSLLQLDANKICADCKRNKHPRWASWNLGVFVCIRCSGIHRGMGTHISRVKSVDLDSWTDEQLASIVNWGNARAKKYWEAKLPPDHVPSESKIENFIRTKYELKRWVMDGPMPNPADLAEDDDDDNVPLAVVKEKQQQQPAAVASASASAPPAAQGDLIGGSDVAAPPRPSSGPPGQRVPPKADPAPPKTTTTAHKDSLLGLDFFQPAAPPRPASTTGTSAALGSRSRPDLKQSILSLYASAPKQTQTPTSPGLGSGMFTSNLSSPAQPSSAAALGGLGDAFGQLSFSNPPSAPPGPPAKPADPFAALGNAAASPKPAAAASSAFGALGAGNFFGSSTGSGSAGAAAAKSKPVTSSFGDFGDFGAAPSAQSQSQSQSQSQPAQIAPSSAMGDLFDFSVSTSAAPPQPSQAPSHSVFNLSSTTTSAKANDDGVGKPAGSTGPLASLSSPWGNASSSVSSAVADPWGSNVWGSSTTTETVKTAPATTTTFGHDFGGWGGSSVTATSTAKASSGSSGAPAVATDEEFGGWTSSPANVTTTTSSKPVSGFSGNDDLFTNVWQ